MPLPSVLDEIDRLFDELVRRPWGRAARQLVPAELHEVEDGWVVEIPVEGLQAADLKIGVSGRQLTVSGRRQRHREERQRGSGWSHSTQEISFERTIPLPAEADPDTIDAKIEGATLSIHVRKRRP
jgi:HSP20 family protein